MKRIATGVVVITLLLVTILCGCGAKETGAGSDVSLAQKNDEKESEALAGREDTAEPLELDHGILSEVPEEEAEGEAMQKSSAASNGKVVVIDAGHQKQQNKEQEPIGPGASQTKAKVASGTSGAATGISEYQLNLTVALQLEQELKIRGYDVVMIRTENDVNISNAERADVANSCKADVFIRIHANGAESSSVHGAETLCMTSGNPYNGDLYQQSRKLSDCVLDSFCASTGAKNRGVIETDTMSGINWCQVPVTIMEMGYMSNPEEDSNMSDASYQTKMVQGMANGIDQYFQ